MEMWFSRAGRFGLILLCFLCRKRSKRLLIRLMKPSNSSSAKMHDWVSSVFLLFFSLLSSLSSCISASSPSYTLTFCSSLLFPPSVRWLSLKWTNKSSGGKEVAYKRIRGVSCGCVLSHASLVAHRDYQRVQWWLVVLCQFEGDLFNITDMYSETAVTHRPERPLKLMWVCHPLRSRCYLIKWQANVI